jgi:GTPase SAR1 family protein
MGCLIGKHTKSIESKKIDKGLQELRKQNRCEIKILLLGAGESGKSTFTKQIKIIHLGGFPEDERMHFKEVIFENVIYSIKGLVAAAEKNKLELTSSNKVIAEKLMEVSTVELDPELGGYIKSIYADSAIKKTFEQYTSFHLLDSTHYFLSNIDRIVQPEYIPSVEDLLRCRSKTTGIQELTLEIEQNRFIIVDVGGQRSERKKWIHCFQDVTAVLFFVALSEYDLKLYEDEETNRMHESLKLFDDICNSKWFINIPIILFLNKMDLFKEKIRKVNITEAFPDYDGPQTFSEASEYIQNQFISVNDNPEKGVYPHITCATNTDNIKTVFVSVKSIVLQAAISAAGF